MTTVVAVYRLPAGSPHPYAAVEWRCAPGKEAGMGAVNYEPDIAHARAHAPTGFLCRNREPGDAPSVLETWHPPENEEAETA